jgi:predicted nuclease with TOPRIM domain
MPVENPQVEKLEKVNVIDKKLDDIDNKFDQKNDEFIKEMDIVKNEINNLSKEYNTFDERLKTSFDNLKKDYNDLFPDAKLDNQSYYGIDKIESLEYKPDEIFNNNQSLFDSIHANRMLLSNEATIKFKNTVKEEFKKSGYEVDSNFKCENQIDNWTKVFRIDGNYITENATWKKLFGNDIDLSFGNL